MPKEPFETEVEALFAEAAEFDDAEAFAVRVSERVTKLLRTERLVHGVAFSIGGLIAVLELSQPSLWASIGGVAQRASTALSGAHIAIPQNPAVWGLLLGAVLLSVYVGSLLREN